MRAEPRVISGYYIMCKQILQRYAYCQAYSSEGQAEILFPNYYDPDTVFFAASNFIKRCMHARQFLVLFTLPFFTTSLIWLVNVCLSKLLKLLNVISTNHQSSNIVQKGDQKVWYFCFQSIAISVYRKLQIRQINIIKIYDLFDMLELKQINYVVLTQGTFYLQISLFFYFYFILIGVTFNKKKSLIFSKSIVAPVISYKISYVSDSPVKIRLVVVKTNPNKQTNLYLSI